jgi:hypothetical protein
VECGQGSDCRCGATVGLPSLRKRWRRCCPGFRASQTLLADGLDSPMGGTWTSVIPRIAIAADLDHGGGEVRSRQLCIGKPVLARAVYIREIS